MFSTVTKLMSIAVINATTVWKPNDNANNDRNDDLDVHAKKYYKRCLIVFWVNLENTLGEGEIDPKNISLTF